MKPETIKNHSFKNYLTKTFGSRIDKVLQVDDRGVELLISQLPIVNQTNTTAYDKCSLCSGSLYRQDIPFWTGSHKNKRGTISYSEYKLNNSTMVFAIPHFVGNLRIGIDYKNSFNKFKDRCIDKINNQNK